MKKIHLIVAACLVAAGLLLFTAALFATDFTFDFYGEGQQQTTVEITEPFQNISVCVNTSDVRFYPSRDGTCKVVFTEGEHLSHTASVREDTLTVDVADTRLWYEHLFSVVDLSVEIYLPQSRYVHVQSETDTGDFCMPDGFLFSTAQVESDTGNILWQADLSGGLRLCVDTGRIEAEGVSAAFLEAETDTGNIVITDTVVLKTMELESDTGDVILDRVDGESIRVTADTGNVTGTVLTEKLFRAKSNTGRVDVPWDTRGGDCIVTTDTGRIRLSVAE